MRCGRRGRDHGRGTSADAAPASARAAQEGVINYLAHIYLAGPDPGLRAGALLGDFVKGPVGEHWPSSVARGIRLHRRIDILTDAHPVWRRSRARFPRELRRFAGITVDLCYDHFLARHWAAHHAQPLDAFTRAAYADIGVHAAHFPPRLRHIFPRMVAEDWLAGYAHFEAVQRALTRMSLRSPRAAPLAATGPAAAALYEHLEGDFALFFPALRAGVTALAGAMPQASPRPGSCPDS